MCFLSTLAIIIYATLSMHPHPESFICDYPYISGKIGEKFFL